MDAKPFMVNEYVQWLNPSGTMMRGRVYSVGNPVMSVIDDSGDIIAVGTDELTRPSETDLMTHYAEKAGKIRSEHIEMLAAAFLKLTNLPADQCEIVEQWDGPKLTWHVRQRPRDLWNGDHSQEYQYLAKRVEGLIQQNDDLKRQLAHKEELAAIARISKLNEAIRDAPPQECACTTATLMAIGCQCGSMGGECDARGSSKPAP